MGAAAGLIPCPSALVVLLGAIAQGEIALGMLLIVAFSAGLAATLTVLGLAVVYAGRALSRLPVPGRIAAALPDRVGAADRRRRARADRAGAAAGRLSLDARHSRLIRNCGSCARREHDRPAPHVTARRPPRSRAPSSCCARRGLRVSSARRLVLEALFAAERPLTAEEIAAGLEGWLPASDLASVYRNLDTLEELGLVRHFHLGHGAGRYALAAAGDVEFVSCERCGAVASRPGRPARPRPRR